MTETSNNQQSQIKIIEQYLKIETNYAIILEGKYGIGKTYFFKNTLSPKMKGIKLPSNNKKNYRPIHISLFGIKNIEEIPQLIFFELYPILKNKKLKIGAGLVKAVLRGAVNISTVGTFGNIDDYLADITPDSKDIIDEKQIVICFDDLDRKSEKLSLIELYGYINSLVENIGAKIIIISNDSGFKGNEEEDLKKLKEKVVGTHIPFKPNYSETYEAIIKNRYKDRYGTYYEFLKDNKEIIFFALKQNDFNLRSLIYFLEHFHFIFSSLEEVFQRDREFAFKKMDKQKAVLVCSLAIAFEFKGGKLSDTDISTLISSESKELSQLDIDWSKAYLVNTGESDNTERKKITKDINEKLREKYSPNEKMYLFKAVMLYFIGIEYFDVSLLVKDLNGYFLSEEESGTPWQKTLNKLTDRTFMDMDDNTYKTTTNELLKHVDKGKYDLHQYGTIFYCVTRLNNIMNFDFIHLKERLKKGINKGREKYNYISDFEWKFEVHRQAEFYEEKKEIINYCIEVNKSLKEEEDRKEKDYLFELFKTDFDKFRFLTASLSSDYGHEPCWSYFKLEEVMTTIEKLKVSEIHELALYFKYRNQVNIEKEKENLMKIKEKISIEEDEGKLRSFYLNQLKESLSEVLSS